MIRALLLNRNLPEGPPAVVLRPTRSKIAPQRFKDGSAYSQVPAPDEVEERDAKAASRQAHLEHVESVLALARGMVLQSEAQSADDAAKKAADSSSDEDYRTPGLVNLRRRAQKQRAKNSKDAAGAKDAAENAVRTAASTAAKKAGCSVVAQKAAGDAAVAAVRKDAKVLLESIRAANKHAKLLEAVAAIQAGTNTSFDDALSAFKSPAYGGVGSGGAGGGGAGGGGAGDRGAGGR